jgi:pilus assembly protein CpaB
VASLSMNKRAVAVVLAVVMAAIAAIALVSYVRGVETEVRQEAEAVDAYVAKEEIPAGMSAGEAISQGFIAREPVPRRNLADGAITSLDQLEGQVATVNIAQGEQILVTRFGQTAQVGSGLGEIPEDLQAISLSVGYDPGVLGFINPGDRVSVMARIGDDETARAQFVVQDVEVLALGRRVISTSEEGETGSSIQYSDEQVRLTLAVLPEQAEILAFAIWQGDVYFTLLPEGQGTSDTPGRSFDNIFEGGPVSPPATTTDDEEDDEDDETEETDA